jgi:hypothetical protein
MTYHHYMAGREIERFRHEHGLPFYGMIQAAMRGADTDNLARLRAAFPEVYEDLKARYDAPGGVLPGDPAVNGDV